MSKAIEISNKEARKIIVLSQKFDKGLSSLDVIKHLGYVQIDTLSVTERAHHHVIFSRNSKYNKTELQEMMRAKEIFEYWSHAAAILPMEHYRFSLIRKNKYAQGDHHWFDKDKKLMEYVLDRIKSEGPLQSKDFKHATKSKGEWYEWKPAKNALEQLFMDGELMVKERVNFHKVYDLAERVLPNNINTTVPTIKEYYQHLIDTTINIQGLAKVEEIVYLRKGIKKGVQAHLDNLVENNQLIKIKVNNNIYYSKELKIELLNNGITTNVQILNPFDHIVIQRKRLGSLFNFNYQLECYVPEAKRKFGYYVLPILFGDEFVGRLDAKADRKTNIFTVKNLQFENQFKRTETFDELFAKSLNDFAQFCRCQEVEFL